MSAICGKDPNEEERLHQKAATMDMDKTNIILVVLQIWLGPLINLGAKYTILPEDLPPCPTQLQTTYILERFYTHWSGNRRKALKVFFSSFLSPVIVSGIAEFLFYALNFAQPYLIQAFVRYFERADEGLDAPEWEGVLYSLGLAAVALFGSVIVMVKFYNILKLASQMRAAIMSAVFEKTLVVAPNALGDMSRGKIMNLMSNDSMRAFEFSLFFHVLWSSPLCIIVAMILMYLQLGTPAFVAVGLMVLLFPYQIFMARLIRRFRLRTISLTDRRLKLTNEILENIRIIKLYAWEASMADKLSRLRSEEVSTIRIGLFLRTLNQITLMVWPGIVTYLTVLMYNHLYDDMSNDKVFLILAYLNTCRFPISLLPACLSSVTEFFVASRRISDYLMKDELPTRNNLPNHQSRNIGLNPDENSTTTDDGEGNNGFPTMGSFRRSGTAVPPRADAMRLIANDNAGDRIVNNYQSQQLDDLQRIVSGEAFGSEGAGDNNTQHPAGNASARTSGEIDLNNHDDDDDIDGILVDMHLDVNAQGDVSATITPRNGGVTPTPTPTPKAANSTALSINSQSDHSNGNHINGNSALMVTGEPYNAIIHPIESSAVVIRDCDFYWTTLQREPRQLPVLANVSISIGVGKLYGLIGGVGIGKTAFILGMLGELAIVQRKNVMNASSSLLLTSSGVYGNHSSDYHDSHDEMLGGNGQLTRDPSMLGVEDQSELDIPTARRRRSSMKSTNTDSHDGSISTNRSDVTEYFDVIGQMGKYSFIGSTEVIPSEAIAIFGRVGYCSQDPWLLSGSLRHNITLGLPYDDEKFERVIAAAALKTDLTVLAKGADTEVGDGGVSLSGGQRARCAFARLLYWSDELDIVLLDDIFAAVDVAVAKTMFFQGVKGFLAGKTVIMSLNSHFNFLTTCDQVISLEPSNQQILKQYQSENQLVSSTNGNSNPSSRNDNPSNSDGNGNDGSSPDTTAHHVIEVEMADITSTTSTASRPPSIIGYVGTFQELLARGTTVLSTFEQHANSHSDDMDDIDDQSNVDALDNEEELSTDSCSSSVSSYSEDYYNVDDPEPSTAKLMASEHAYIKNQEDDEELEALRGVLPIIQAQELIDDTTRPGAITDESLAPYPSFSMKDAEIIEAEEGLILRTHSHLSSLRRKEQDGHVPSLDNEDGDDDDGTKIEYSISKLSKRSKLHSKLADGQDGEHKHHHHHHHTHDKPQEKKALTTAQKSDTHGTNNLDARYYFSYIRGSKGTFGMIVCLIVMAFTAMGAQGFRVLSDLWIVNWANDSPYVSGVSDHTLDWWTASCGAIIAVCFLFFLSRILSFLAVNLDASQHLHDTTFRKVLNAPMSWFDVTLLGHILNRFSKDIDTVDNTLPDNLSSFTQQLLMLIGIVVLSCIATYYFVIPLVPLLFLLYWFQKMFRKTALQVKRIENISLSPVFASFAAVTRGAEVIRAYNLQEYFISRHRTLINECTRAILIYNFLQRWLGFRLEIVAALFILAISFLGVFVRGAISPSVSALAITYSMQLVGSLNFTTRTFIVLQSCFTSVERLEAYFDIPQEARYYTHKDISDAIQPPEDIDQLLLTPPPATAAGGDRKTDTSIGNNPLALRKKNIVTRLKGWPWRSEIKFKNVSMRYREDLPLVLNNLSITIPSGKKVGVIGRTGAGKSSLLLVLFRMVELARGSVEIDGIDIASIGIGDLRSRMSIITQQPTMFSGTIRYNLDPFDMHSDEEIITSLKQAHIWDKVESLPDGIYSQISESGSNISQAEKQLLCIARALILKNKIIVLDEATASVSPDTDAAIQSTIRECFDDCTIITIAHRLDTICDFDYVMVLGPINNDRIEQGFDDETTNSLLEFDHPYNLLTNSTSYFYRMASETGEGGYQNLLTKAKASYIASNNNGLGIDTSTSSSTADTVNGKSNDSSN